MTESNDIVQARYPRARGFIAWDPTPKKRALIAAVEDVLDTYADHLPLTTRQVYYRLVAGGKVEKTERAYKALAESINRAKRARMLPWHAFRDDGNVVNRSRGFESVVHLKRAMLDALDDGIALAVHQPLVQIVVTEAAGMVPMLGRVAGDFGASVRSGGGFGSTQSVYELACLIRDADKPVLIHHVGDYDPSGVHVFQSMKEDVSAFVHELGGEVTFRRIAVTPEQIGEFDLPTAPAKPTDNRVFDGETVQCEALPPDTLSSIVSTALAEGYDLEAEERGVAESEAALDELRQRIES